MPLLIDGYNVIFAAGWLGRGNPAKALRAARKRLLRLVTTTVPKAELARSTIIYDSQRVLNFADDESQNAPLEIRFAHGFDEADDLIEIYIARSSTPKQLLVVSSDHRLQQAARRRKASFIDSDLWLAEMERQQAYLARQQPEPDETPSAKKAPGENDVDYWLRVFGDVSLPEEARDVPGSDIFPPGYAEDELDDL